MTAVAPVPFDMRSKLGPLAAVCHSPQQSEQAPSCGFAGRSLQAALALQVCCCTYVSTPILMCNLYLRQHLSLPRDPAAAMHIWQRFIQLRRGCSKRTMHCQSPAYLCTITSYTFMFQSTLLYYTDARGHHTIICSPLHSVCRCCTSARKLNTRHPQVQKAQGMPLAGFAACSSSCCWLW